MTKLEIVPEYALSTEAVRHIAELRSLPAASQHQRPALFGTPPAFIALLRDKGILLGHLRFDFQQLLVDLQPVNVFCLYELCFASEDARKAHFTHLIEGIEGMGRQQSVEFLLLFSDEPAWLLAHGFEVRSNVLVPSHATQLLQQHYSEQSLLVKPLGNRLWQGGRLESPTDKL